MNQRLRFSITLCMPYLVVGCIDITLPESGLFAGSISVVLKGTAEADGDCVVWRSQDDRVFTLFQGHRVDNDDFDLVITPGTPSRLLLDIRSDLDEPCLPEAQIANVDQVLEINGEDTGPAERALETASKTIDTLKANLATIIETQRAQLEERVGEFDEGVRTFINDLEARVTESAENLRAQLEEREIPDRDQIVEDVRASLDAFVNEVEGRLDDTLHDARDRIQGFVEAIRSELEKRRSETEGRFEERLEEIKQSLAEGLGELQSNLDNLNEKLEQLAVELREQLEDELAILTGELQQQIDEDLDGLKGDLRQRFEELLEGIDPDLGDIEGRLEDLIVAIRPIIEDRVEQFLEELAEQLGLSQLQLQILRTTIQNLIEQRLGGEATTIETEDEDTDTASDDLVDNVPKVGYGSSRMRFAGPVISENRRSSVMKSDVSFIRTCGAGDAVVLLIG